MSTASKSTSKLVAAPSVANTLDSPASTAAICIFANCAEMRLSRPLLSLPVKRVSFRVRGVIVRGRASNRGRGSHLPRRYQRNNRQTFPRAKDILVHASQANRTNRRINAFPSRGEEGVLYQPNVNISRTSPTSSFMLTLRRAAKVLAPDTKQRDLP